MFFSFSVFLFVGGREKSKVLFPMPNYLHIETKFLLYDRSDFNVSLYSFLLGNPGADRWSDRRPILNVALFRHSPLIDFGKFTVTSTGNDVSGGICKRATTKRCLVRIRSGFFNSGASHDCHHALKARPNIWANDTNKPSSTIAFGNAAGIGWGQ